MSQDEQPDGVSGMRERLNQAFDDPGLDAFCLDHFPKVYDKFGRGMRKDEKITLLLDYCRRLEDLDSLSAALEAWKEKPSLPPLSLLPPSAVDKIVAGGVGRR